MKSARELLDELNAADEHTRIEAKRASEIGKSVIETVCAFANEPGLGGGYLLLGVTPAEDSFWPMYEAEGIDDPDKVQADLASQCSSMLSTAIRPRMKLEDVGGKNVIVVFVDEAGPAEKPIHFKNKPLPASAWRRIGSTDQQCTEDDMVVLYGGRRGSHFDEQVLPDAELSDIDPEVVSLYREMRRDVDSTAEELSWSDEDLLTALKAVKPTDQGSKPTVAGVLLFGTPMALRRLFPMMRIDYVRIVGTQWVENVDRRFDTVEIRSPLIRAINRARATILDDIPKAFSLPQGEVQAQEIPTLPDKVIREVVANAVMHRDYRVNGSIMLIRYSNRLEVRNPGYSLKSPERLGEPGSETRNPTIAMVLHELKLAETKGSGIRVMRDEMETRGLSPPLLDSDRTGNQFVCQLLFHHFLGEPDLQWLSSLGHDLSDEQRRAMVQAREVGAITNSTFRVLNRDSDTLDASRQLRKLCDLGLLEKRGKGVNTYYKPTAEAISDWPPDNGKSQNLASKSQNLASKSQNLGTKPQNHDADPEMTDELRGKLERLGKKAATDTITDLIYDLLVWKEMTLAELARHIERTPNHISRTYLKDLIQADLVRPMANNPNDPNQTYRATKMIKPDDEATE